MVEPSSNAPASPPAGAAPARPRPHSRSLDPQVVLAMKDLELRARVVVEGLRSGLHRSPFTGFSVEFTEYRQYTPGDDLRYLDWRVLGRTDRHMLRKYEEETNVRCQLLLDVSRSMAFGSRPGLTKSDYARTAAAALVWFLHEQRDGVGSARFADGITDFIAPRWRLGHRQHLLTSLARADEGRATDVGLALRQLARLLRRRSVIVILSDFLQPVEEWVRALGELAAAGHDLRALQVLDPAELNLEDYGRAALWEDLETGQTRFVDPRRAQTPYRQQLDAHQQALAQAFHQHGVVHQTVATSEPIDRALLRFLRLPGNRPARPRRSAARFSP